MNTVISVEHLSKVYRLGQIGTGTLTNDLKVWWARKRGQPNPLLKIGQSENNHRGSDTLWALEDINFQVQQGEVLGIIGRNGAGKSTLLKILSRVTAPTSGQIKVKGRIASLLEVGTGFHPDLTGRENIYLNGAILGMTTQEVRQKFDEIVAFAEVEKFIDTPVKRYSSGMYVRLAFAVAAHLESEILLVDEVLAVGDIAFQRKCLGKMDAVAHAGRTVLFVSHNMNAISNLCQSSALFMSGKLTLLGLTDTVIQQYNQQTKGNQIAKLSNKIREGTQELIFSEINIFDEKGNNTIVVQSHRRTRFEVGYEFAENVTKTNIAIEIKITDAFDQVLCTFSTYLTDSNFFNPPEQGCFICEVDSIPLAEGDYYINISLYINQRITDLVPNAAIIHIVNSPETKIVRTFKNKYHGIVVAPCSWSFRG